MSEAISNTRNSRKSLIGEVTSSSGDKTIKVTYFYKTPHPLYRKEIKRKTVVHAHDAENENVSVIATAAVEAFLDIDPDDWQLGNKTRP